MQIDHVVPLSRGGLDHPVNLQPLCRGCNEVKQARDFDYRSAEQLAMVKQVWVIGFELQSGRMENGIHTATDA